MNFEKYIKNQPIDIHDPDIEKLWNGLENKRQRKKNTVYRAAKWIAAILILSMFIGTLIRHEIKMQEQITSLSQINQDLAEEENNYTQLVSEKWDTYVNMKGNTSPIAADLINELHELDTVYDKGIQDILIDGYNERAVLILLDSYEKRLRIIEQLIYEKEKQIRYENKSQRIDL